MIIRMGNATDAGEILSNPSLASGVHALPLMAAFSDS
jgi:hypothetical protein